MGNNKITTKWQLCVMLRGSNVTDHSERGYIREFMYNGQLVFLIRYTKQIFLTTYANLDT